MAAGKVWLWAAAVVVCVSCSASAAVITWGVNGGQWSEDANWIDGSAPGAGDEALFNIAGWLVRLDADTEIAGLTMGDAAEANKRLLVYGVNDAQDASFTLTTGAIENLSASWLDMAAHITAPLGGLTVATDAGPVQAIRPSMGV